MYYHCNLNYQVGSKYLGKLNIVPTVRIVKEHDIPIIVSNVAFLDTFSVIPHGIFEGKVPCLYFLPIYTVLQ